MRGIPNVTVAGVAVSATLLTGCGGGAVQPTTSLSRATSASTSATAVATSSSTTSASSSASSPVATPASLSVKAFGGTYRNTAKIVSVLPKGAPVESLPDSTWTVKTKGCNTASCTGTVTSSSGAKYGWTWDGSTLAFTRGDVKINEPCEPTGSVQARRVYRIQPVRKPHVDATGHITDFTMVVTQKLEIDKLVNCQLSPFNWTQMRIEVYISE